jgi:hypothetical protein
MMYREKLMLGGCAKALDESDVMQICFESGSAEKGALFEELDDEKILLPVVGETLPCHRTPVQTQSAFRAQHTLSHR